MIEGFDCDKIFEVTQPDRSRTAGWPTVAEAEASWLDIGWVGIEKLFHSGLEKLEDDIHIPKHALGIVFAHFLDIGGEVSEKWVFENGSFFEAGHD